MEWESRRQNLGNSDFRAHFPSTLSAGSGLPINTVRAAADGFAI